MKTKPTDIRGVFFSREDKKTIENSIRSGMPESSERDIEFMTDRVIKKTLEDLQDKDKQDIVVGIMQNVFDGLMEIIGIGDDGNVLLRITKEGEEKATFLMRAN